ncbi:MAG: lamin tail domain-containing protein [Treponema sp.]|jgi:hypothetical protein|nr:lamin tail domain-containing protein [Treponema sp.]
MKKTYRYMALGLIIRVLTLTLAACSGEDVIEQFLGDDPNFQTDTGPEGEGANTSTTAPVFLDYKAVSSTEINFQFSLPVKVVSLNFDPPVEVESWDEGNTITVTLLKPLKGGERFVADLLVEDEKRNTLNVLVPFRARNDQIPQLLITELRTEVSKLKVEFVELKTLSAGNLGALRLFAATESMDVPLFEFPPMEIEAGKYLVVHLRSAEEGILNETGPDPGESGGTEASPEAWDFWVPESKERFRKTDAVYLLDQDDQIIDSVLFSETAGVSWAKESLAKAAEFLGSRGAWLPKENAGSGEAPPDNPPPGPADAVDSSKTTNTRSICRDETLPDSNSAADWYITVASGATPGKANNPKRYVAN